MHYLLQVPEFENADLRPTDAWTARSAWRSKRRRRRSAAKLESLDAVSDEMGTPYGDRLLSLVMLNVLDEKWKDHLYDLDQLRNAIHYRSWGQKDPLIEYKQEAYTMFVDLMNDIYNTFTERFLKVQLVFEQPAGAGPASSAGARRSSADEAVQRARHPRGHSRRDEPAERRRQTERSWTSDRRETPRAEKPVARARIRRSSARDARGR